MDRFARASHVFVDESKARGYLFAATVVAPANLSIARRELVAMRRPRQDRIHFKTESESSRRSLLSRMSSLDLSVTVYLVAGLGHKASREACVTALVDDLIDSRAARLILERDESLEQADRRMIAALLRSRDASGVFEYQHQAAKAEPLLWVSDAVAWAHQAGGDWIRRVATLTASVVDLG
ncbi:MAG: hypothetical protein FWD85_03930 [Microbacteriaceae bacterium]|nr:hypothetical protein [Microbacteriaceae bacterium]MCL2794438.1 hypothetical protein [Microbacteriaceae bacterium]